VLTVMSSMDSHMIRVTWVGMVEMLGVGQSCLLGQATAVDSVVCSIRGEELFDLVVEAFGYRMQPLLSASQTIVSLPWLKPPCHDFPTLAE
jgi:hypothetical protein